MTQREQELIAKTAQFNCELRRLMQEIAELRGANAELRVERDAADVLLGQAIDRLQKIREGRW